MDDLNIDLDVEKNESIVNTDLEVDKPPKEKEELYDIREIDGKEREYAFRTEDETYAGDYIREILSKQDDFLRMGTYTYNNTDENKIVRVPMEGDIMRHCGSFAETGGGKSTMMKHYVWQFINKGYGCSFIDPKVDDDDDGLFDSDAFDLMRAIPEHRKEDILYLTPREIDGYSYNINLISTPKGIDKDSKQFESIVETQSDMLVGIFRAIGDDGYWGPRMDDILSALFQNAIRSDRMYSLGDIHYILTNPETALEKFADDASNELEDEFITDPLRKLVDLSEDKFESLIRRTNLIIYNRDLRNLVFGEQTDIPFKEILEEDKILIVDINKDSQKLKKVLMGYIISMLYSTAKISSNKMHFLFCDEYDIVLDNGLISTSRILRRGRSQNFHLWMSTQTPSTLKTQDPKEDSSVYDACSNLEILTSGKLADKEGNVLLDMYNPPPNEELTAEDITSPRKYHFYTQLPPSDEKEAEAIEMRGFPPAPPIRSDQEAFELIKQSMKRYGSKHVDYMRYKQSIRPYLLEDGGSITKSEGMKIVQIASIFDEEHDDRVDRKIASRETIDKIVNCAENIDKEEFELEKWLEQQCGRDRLEATKVEGEMYYKITSEGKDEIELSTGTSGSAGNEQHKIMLQDTRKQFAKYGIYVQLDLQGGGGEQPDGRGKIFEPAVEQPFSEHISTDEQFIIEAEKSTTADKPYKMLKNLRKAHDDNDFVVFVTKQRVPEKSGRIELYEKIEKIVDSGFIRDIEQNGKRLYNTDNNLESEEMYPLRKLPDPSQSSTNQSKWYISVDGESLKLVEKMSSGAYKTISQWSPVKEFQNWSIDEFPAYAEQTDDGYIINDMETEAKHGPFEKVKDSEKYRRVKRPWVPEIEYKKLPQRDDFGLFVMPTEGRKLNTKKVYYKGQLYDIGESPQSKPPEDDSDTGIDDKESDDELQFFD
jgi:hypothetical protein